VCASHPVLLRLLNQEGKEGVDMQLALVRQREMRTKIG
jgi:hypothetical protein